MRVFLTSMLLASLLYILPPPNEARADFQSGLDAYQSGDYKTAYSEFLTSAEKGDPHAQHMLGFVYANGRGAAIAPVKTVTWWTRAARQGFAPAQYTLGTLYQKGLGVNRDTKTALRWIGRAADAGYAEAQYALGIIHATGRDKPVDLASAYMWLGLAATSRGLEQRAYWGDVDKHLSPAQRLHADELKKNWDQ